LLLGLGGDAAEPVGVDPFAGAARLLVTGPPGSGRSTVLELLLCEALRQRIRVVVAAASSPRLEKTAHRYGVAVVRPHDTLSAIDAGTLLLADDSDLFADTPTGDALAALTAGSRRDVAVVVAARDDDVTLAFRGIAAAVRRSRRAIVLHPGRSHDALAVAPRSRSPAPAGRGILLDPESTRGADGPIAVQIALPSRPELIPCVGIGDLSAERRSP
jgi:S-DNA-T family DNA segregation ATPase FtsK/SpoIIIE